MRAQTHTNTHRTERDATAVKNKSMDVVIKSNKVVLLYQTNIIHYLSRFRSSVTSLFINHFVRTCTDFSESHYLNFLMCEGKREKRVKEKINKKGKKEEILLFSDGFELCSFVNVSPGCVTIMLSKPSLIIANARDLQYSRQRKR